MSGEKKSKKGNGKDGDGKNGGILEPIIEDLKEWIGKRRPMPIPSGMTLINCLE